MARQKKLKTSSKHGKRCNCENCKIKRSAIKKTRKMERFSKRVALVTFGRNGTQRTVKTKNNLIKTGEPGFLSGGHQHLKLIRDLTKQTKGVNGKARRVALRHKFVNISVMDFSVPYKIARVYDVNLDRANFDKLGEIERFKNVELLFHGTCIDNISSIGHSNFRMGSGGLLGGGIYFAPNIHKSFNYSMGAKYSAILICAVRPGVKLDVKEHPACARRENEPVVRICKKLVVDNGCDAAFLNYGYYHGAWGGLVKRSELCVYNQNQAIPVMLLVYERA